MSKLKFIKEAYKLTLEDEPQPCNAICAMTGDSITQGYRLSDIISVASADIGTIFPFGGEWVCVDGAILFKASKTLRGNLLVLEDNGLAPLISKDSAIAENRPCWRDLIMDMSLDTPMVAIFSDESKRRLWPSARMSVFGSHWQPFFNGVPYKAGSSQAAPVQRSLNVDVLKLRSVLSVVEYAYSLGFSKWGIATGLLGTTQLVESMGLLAVRNLDRNLANFRNSDEMLLSCFVAQKQAVEILKVEKIKAEPVMVQPIKQSIKEKEQLCLF